MSQLIELNENGVVMQFQVDEENRIRLTWLSNHPGQALAAEDPQLHKLAEISVSGMGHMEHHGMKQNMSGLGDVLRYADHRNYRNTVGRKLEITQKYENISVISHYQFYDGLPVLRSWTEVINEGTTPVGLENVSSFNMCGLSAFGRENWDQNCMISIPHNNWYGECQWHTSPISQMGLSEVNYLSVKPICCSNVGSWSTCSYLPMGAVTHKQTGETLLWQIEHNGSWNWEIGDCDHQLYLLLSGPNEEKSHWWKNLKQGERFCSVPAAVALSGDGFDDAVAAMTRYRRRIRRKNRDNEVLPVIFNDYMNCLSGDPTTEKLLPLIDVAAEIGCEYFCIDAGWYADGSWWDGVGQWLPSEQRFPGGIEEPMQYIRSKGMIPGLWLEPEVMGINCPLADKLSDDWFFMRHGRRVVDHGRYQLDFRNPEVRKYADGILARLVEQYGAGYIKMDYNIDSGIGTELNADSFGDGLLAHNRAYLQWLDSVFERYPDLVIENCGSGGLRMDYAMLSRLSIQSSSDQTDYLKNAVITSACLSAVTPEQCACWSYPLENSDSEQVIMNMVGAMMMRFHQSGQLVHIGKEGIDLIREGIETYKKVIRKDIPNAVPFWPLGMPHYDCTFNALGLECGDHRYLAVWRFGDKDTVKISMKNAAEKAKLLYPAKASQQMSLSADGREMTVTLPVKNSARIYLLR